jgi:hypothetical protein
MSMAIGFQLIAWYLQPCMLVYTSIYSNRYILVHNRVNDPEVPDVGRIQVAISSFLIFDFITLNLYLEHEYGCFTFSEALYGASSKTIEVSIMTCISVYS